MMFEHEISSLQSSNRCAHLRESNRTLRDGSFGAALSQALRARLRSHRPSGTFRNRLWLAECGPRQTVAACRATGAETGTARFAGESLSSGDLPWVDDCLCD